MDDAANLASSEDAATMDRRQLRLRLQEELLMLMLIDSLCHKTLGGDGGDDLQDVSLSDQSAIFKELLITTQRLLDTQLLHLLNAREERRATMSSSSLASVASTSVQQLMDNKEVAAMKKKRKAAAAKKRRNRKNKAAAKHRKTKLSWRGAGMIMMALSSITTLLVTLSLVHHSDGLGEGNVMPALQPSTHNSLRHRSQKEQSSNAASSSSSEVIISSPVTTDEPPPLFSPTAVSVNRYLQSDEEALPECLDTPNWKDEYGYGCDWYERIDGPGCPTYGNEFKGDMGVANEHCCYCGGGSHTLPPTTSPWPSLSPSISASPTEFCLDTPNWKDGFGRGCDWYERIDGPGCPKYGDKYEGDMGVANNHCCYCGGGSHTLPPTTSPWPSLSPSISASPTEPCSDTPYWKDNNNKYGHGCDWYENEEYDYRCSSYGDKYEGDMGPATEHCCHCGGGSRTCEELRSKCQKYFSVLGIQNGVLAPTGLCEKAESCSCVDEDYDFKVGLYNECKCNFWSHLCDGTREGVACDYAAEYCCGDYAVILSRIVYTNSPSCYCDFFNYIQNELGDTWKWKPKAINTTGAIGLEGPWNDPCGHLEEDLNDFETILSGGDAGGFGWNWVGAQKLSLEAIYNKTNGKNWTNNAGWMNDTVPHCQWYGISCNDRGFVTGIDLRDNNLEGQFPVYSHSVTFSWGSPVPESYWIATKYGLANLHSVETIDLANNMLTGTIEYRPLYNLNSLTHFDVSGNQLSGGVDALISPSIIYANFSNNNFTSMHRFQPYKVSPLQTLRSCDVGNNAIKIDATDLLENIPPNIEHFISSTNHIYGSLPASLNILPKLRQFDMSTNALSGKLPTFDDSILTFQELDLSNQANGLTGVIPEELWRSQFLKTLNLAENKLTGTISLDVANMAVLRRFDVSSNRLSGQIPSQIGQLEGTLDYLNLANNTFTGTIPAHLGRLEGASVFVKGDYFDTNANTPLSLCTLSRVEASDVADDIIFCPTERTALAELYDLAKGVEWTDRTNWIDEYISHCDWYGVTCCNEDEDYQGVECVANSRVTKLDLRNNGLSGRLNERIANLTLLDRLDLSDNDIKGPIPEEIGELSELTYLRLSSNAFTGTAPESLVNLANLQLLQMQSNRITGIPYIPRLNETKYGNSSFVADCGVPSAFEKAFNCTHCTMCFVFVLDDENAVDKQGNNFDENRLDEDDKYALSKIGKDSVYSYFVTTKFNGWAIAVATLCAQTYILFFFVEASEVKLQDDKTDIEFTWKCPLDSEGCQNKSDLDRAGWAMFVILMITFLAKDFVNGCKLIYHSSQIEQPFWRWSRIRYFVSGLSLCSITLFALYVSTVYNMAIATSNTGIILNAVIVLFIMDMDEYIFATLKAMNDKWTAHADDSEDTTSGEMKKKLASQEAKIASQEAKFVSQQEELMSQKNQIARQCDEIALLREAVRNIQESLAAAAV